MRRGIVVHPDEVRKSLIDRMAQSGLNTLGIHPVGGVRAPETLAQAIAWRQQPETQRLFAYANGKGIALEFEAHALSWLLPRSLFAEKPEWFRMNEQGMRTPDSNFCSANAEACAYLTRRTEELARHLSSDTHRYFFWMDDVAGKRCMCDSCKRYSASDQQMLALKAMLAGIKAANPAGKLCYIAYQDALQPPQLVSGQEDIFLEYAPFNRDPDRPIADPDSARNAAEAAAIPALLAFFGKKDAQVLEYWMDNSMYSGWKKPPKPFKLRSDVTRQDVRFYRQLGFDSITTFACYLGEDYENLYGAAPIEEYAAILAEEA